MSEFNVLAHELVPAHQIVPEKDEEEILKRLNATKDQLPKIRKIDPVIIALEEIYGEIRDGRMLRILRRSSTSGISEAFRVVQS